MNNKEKYRQLCETETTIPIFSQSWWLDSVAGDHWDVCLVEKDGIVYASLPYVLKERLGFKLLTMPPLTQTLGPWFRETNGKYHKKISIENGLMAELFEMLPPYDHLLQNWHQSRKNWLPLYWKGFSQTTQYTYIIDDLSDLQKVYSDFSSSYRNKIRKASKIVTVATGLEPEYFYTINEKTFSRQNKKTPYDRDLFFKHDKALSERKAREIFYAKDDEGHIHSALYLTWDSMSAYVHMVGEDPEYRKSGAGILLIWEAIKFTKDKLKINKFDFEGSMLKNVERVRRDCGGKQVSYFSIWHTPSKLLKFINLFR